MEEDVLDLTALDSEDDNGKAGKQSEAASAAVAQGDDGSRPTPQKYRASDTHRETLKLLSSLSPAAVKIPSIQEVKKALKELLNGPDPPSLDDIDGIQRELEERLDTHLESRRELIESEVQAYEEASRAMKEEDASQGGAGGDEVSASQGGEDQEGGKKRRRTGGGRSGLTANLPLVLPKMMGSSNSKNKSMLVQVDDERQHLEGDSGAVGRLHHNGKELILDIKGHQYKGHLVRSPALLLVSMGDEEAKVEDVFENLCLLTHHQDHIQHLGGTFLKGADPGAGSDYDSDYNIAGSDDEGGNGKGKKKKQKKTGGGGGGDGGGGGGSSVVKKRKAAPASVSKPRAKLKGSSQGGGATKKAKAAKKGGGGRKSTASKKTTPSRKSVSLGELKKKARKDQDDDDDEEDDDEEKEPDDDDDDDDDSDFSG